MASRQLKKKKNSKNSVRLLWILIPILLFVISLLAGVIIQQHQTQQSLISRLQTYRQNIKIEKVKNATPPAHLSDKPTNPIQQIPPSFGRSITIPILTYHYIGNNPNPLDTLRDDLSVSPDKFDQQMQYLLENGYQPITLDTMFAALNNQAPLPAKAIILTFDDGYIDFYVNAYPILKKYNMLATVFIPTGLMEQSYYLKWEHIKEMDQSGLISFQAHSLTHPNLVSISDQQLKHEVSESKKMLENYLGKPVNWFAYPFGISNERVWNAVKDAGFVGAVGTWNGVVISEGNLYNMPRVKVGGHISQETFRTLLVY